LFYWIMLSNKGKTVYICYDSEFQSLFYWIMLSNKNN